MDSTCLKSFARKKHFSGFYLKWKLFLRVMSTAEIQTPAQVSALKTGLWALLKYCDCTSHKQGKAAQWPRLLKACVPALKPRGFWNWGAATGEKKQSFPLFVSSAFCQLLFEIICLSLGSLSSFFFFNWGWQVRRKVKELEITCTTTTMELERQPFR